MHEQYSSTFKDLKQNKICSTSLTLKRQISFRANTYSFNFYHDFLKLLLKIEKITIFMETFFFIWCTGTNVIPRLAQNKVD